MCGHCGAIISSIAGLPESAWIALWKSTSSAISLGSGAFGLLGASGLQRGLELRAPDGVGL